MSRSSSWFIAAGLGVAAVLGVLLLRGDDPATSPADSADAATSVLSPSVPSENAGGNPTQPGEGARLLQTNLEHASSFARAELGWFALGARPGPLELFRSTDGLSWTPVAAEISEPPAVPDGWAVQYRNLIRVADGWAMTAFVGPADLYGGDTAPRTVHRFVSTDGVRWEPDPGFPPIQIEHAIQVPVHTEDWIVTYAQRPSDPSTFEDPFTDVVNAALAEPPTFEICRFTDRGTVLRLHACDFETFLDVAPEQLSEPDRFEQARACLASLYEGAVGLADSTVSIHGADGSVRSIDTVRLATRPVVDSSGMLVTIEARPAGVAASCEPWLQALGMEERLVHGLARWPLDEPGPEVTELPPGFESFRTLGENALLPLPDGGELYASDSVLWRFSADAPATPEPTSLTIEGEATPVAFTPDATRLLQFRGGVIEIHDLAADSTAELEYTPRSRGKRPIHVDNDVAFVQSGFEIQLLVLR